MTPHERGSVAVAEMLARLSPEARPQAEALFAANPDSITGLGERLLRDEQALATRQADLARATQVNDQFRTDLERWQAQERQRLADLEAARAARAEEPPVTPVTSPTPSSTDALDRPITARELAERERIYAVVTAQLSELAVAHYAEFGERLDIQSMLRDPQIAESGGVLGVYQKQFGDRLQQKADARAETERERLREEGRQQARSEMGKNWPLPSVHGADESMSGLVGLTLTEEQKAARAASGDVIDRATATYHELLAKKAATT